jgi:cation:H+ antiporter
MGAAWDATAVSDALLGILFALAAAISVGTSWLLVASLERVGARLGLSEALLGMLAALAADAPEITAAVTALARHDQRIGAGVVIGSNVFNLAALLGLTAVIAGQIALHRRVIELAGAVALWIAGISVAVVMGACSPLVGLLLVLAVMGPYLAILGMRHERLARLGLPAPWSAWLLAAISEEELELQDAIHPRRGGRRDVLAATVAIAVVVGASVVMEHTASRLGARHAVPPIVIGGLILAGVTSLPNAVAAVYLARRGRGAAVLSTSLSSNAFNVLAGLLIPTTFVGLGSPSGQTTFVAGSYLAMTVLALLCAYVNRGLRRSAGLAILAAYFAFAGVLLAMAY